MFGQSREKDCCEYIHLPKEGQCTCIARRARTAAFKYSPKVKSTMQSHEEAVGRISTDVKSFYARRQPFRIHHGSTNSTRLGLQDRSTLVDISDLCNILYVDPESKTVLVEPNVPMDRLVESTLEHGLVPPVVMEFPGITVGGGYSGTGGESSSFRYGYFNNIVNRVEIVLGNGSIINASPYENADLLHAASGAVGSLGIATLLELQLISAKKYVRTTYIPVGSVHEAVERISREKESTAHDYLDGILFSQTHGAVITGAMTDDLPAATQLQSFSHPGDPWYYLQVKGKTSASLAPTTEYIPLAEYLFRYDRGGFWVGASAFEYFKFPFNRLTRWWLDDFLHTRMLYKSLHASKQSRNYIVQDLALPFSNAVEFVDYTAKSFNIWPLWLCPLRQPKLPSLHPHSTQIERNGETAEMLLNVGLWGHGPRSYDAFITKNRELEQRLREFGGMKWLYAHTCYDEDEFWNMFDREWYDSLRRKYDAEFLPSVWHKVTVNSSAQRQAMYDSWFKWLLSFWPLGGIWGILKAIESGEYLADRNSRWKYDTISNEYAVRSPHTKSTEITEHKDEKA